MSYCGNCGAEVRDGARFCPNCGQTQSGAGQRYSGASDQQYGGSQQRYSAASEQRYGAERNGMRDSSYSKKRDAEENRVMAILAYIGILCLVPYFGAKDSPFAHYHAVRGLNLFIIEVIYSFITGLITTVIGWILPLIAALIGWVLSLGGIAFLILSIIGIVNVCNGVKKNLPYIGNIRFVKR